MIRFSIQPTVGDVFTQCFIRNTYIHTLLRLPSTGLFSHNVNYYIILVINYYIILVVKDTFLH